MGRPTRAETASRIRSIRISDAEWAEYTAAAKRAGVDRSTWIRQALENELADEALDRAAIEAMTQGGAL